MTYPPPGSSPNDGPRVRGAQLITYPDSLGGSLGELADLLDGGWGDLFPAGVHVLPPFPSSGDRGFAPLTYAEIETAFGTWTDLKRIAAHGGLLIDVMVNHISRRSSEFAAFEQHGRASASADLFITLDKVWPHGEPPETDVRRIFLRKPGHPFSDIVIVDTGAVERIWTTFGPRIDWSEQIDLDLNSPVTRELISGWFGGLAGSGATAVRLDAVGYVTKRAGTNCFFVEPEIWDHLDWLREAAATEGLDVLPEVHATEHIGRALVERGYWVYDFALPGLVLHALVTGTVDSLAAHLEASPNRQVTTLDTHDGIPVQPDLDGILPEVEARVIVDHCLARGANLNRVLGRGGVTPPFDAHQINCTYRDAVADDDGYVAARAIQLFAPGRPQIYYVGLLAGRNDHDAVERTGEGRSINRHDYSASEAMGAWEDDVVVRIRRLIDLHNRHPAFEGPLTVSTPNDHTLVMSRQVGSDAATLTVDMVERRAHIHLSGPNNAQSFDA